MLWQTGLKPCTNIFTEQLADHFEMHLPVDDIYEVAALCFNSWGMHYKFQIYWSTEQSLHLQFLLKYDQQHCQKAFGAFLILSHDDCEIALSVSFFLPIGVPTP